MDEFSVPKKVNRHVLKALSILSDEYDQCEVPIDDLIHQVKYQMRNLVPVSDIEYVINQSLYNLRASGLVERTAPRWFALSYRLRSDVSVTSSPNGPLGGTSSKVPSMCPSNETGQNVSYMNANSRIVTHSTELSSNDYIAPTTRGRRRKIGKFKQRRRSSRRRYRQQNLRPYCLNSCDPPIRKRRCRKKCKCSYINKNFSYNCKDMMKGCTSHPYYDTRASTSGTLTPSQSVEITESTNDAKNCKANKEKRDNDIKKLNAVKDGAKAIKVEDNAKMRQNMKDNNCSVSKGTIRSLHKALKIANSIKTTDQTEPQGPVSAKSRSYVN